MLADKWEFWLACIEADKDAPDAGELRKRLTSLLAEQIANGEIALNGMYKCLETVGVSKPQYRYGEVLAAAARRGIIAVAERLVAETTRGQKKRRAAANQRKERRHAE